jgi:hypothetical protein
MGGTGGDWAPSWGTQKITKCVFVNRETCKLCVCHLKLKTCSRPANFDVFLSVFYGEIWSHQGNPRLGLRNVAMSRLNVELLVLGSFWIARFPVVFHHLVELGGPTFLLSNISIYIYIEYIYNYIYISPYVHHIFPHLFPHFPAFFSPKFGNPHVYLHISPCESCDIHVTSILHSSYVHVISI